jgi:hypothetical protein
MVGVNPANLGGNHVAELQSGYSSLKSIVGTKLF